MIKRSKNFTLMELLIVIAIIGLIAAIASPKMGETLNDARKAKFNGNVASILSAVNLYMAHNEGLFQKYDGTTTNSIYTNALTDSSDEKLGALYPATTTELLAYLDTKALEYNEKDGGKGGFIVGAVYVDPNATNSTPANAVLQEDATCNATHVRVYAVPDTDNNYKPGDAAGTFGATATALGAGKYDYYAWKGVANTNFVLVYDSTTKEGLVDNVWSTIGQL